MSSSTVSLLRLPLTAIAMPLLRWMISFDKAFVTSPTPTSVAPSALRSRFSGSAFTGRLFLQLLVPKFLQERDHLDSFFKGIAGVFGVSVGAPFVSQFF